MINSVHLSAALVKILTEPHVNPHTWQQLSIDLLLVLLLACACTCVDLEVTSGVDEQVWGLQVAVQHVGWVDVLQASQDLVEEVADVVVAQLLGLQQLVQVRLHQSLHDVAGGGWWASRRTTADQRPLSNAIRDTRALMQFSINISRATEWVKYICEIKHDKFKPWTRSSHAWVGYLLVLLFPPTR